MSQTLLVGNWKMKLGAEKAASLAGKLGSLQGSLRKTAVWVAPTFTAIPAVKAALGSTSVKVGAQNVHWEAEGAFTGEVSVPMLREVGCEFAIVGHSERRHIFAESRELCAKRAASALKSGFTVIFCIGETIEERKAGITNRVLEEQLAALFELIAEKDATPLIFAYEPVWAIGTGVVAQIRDIEEAHGQTAALWSRAFKSPCPPILYGGSVSAENLREILGVKLVAGGLIGGASLKYDSMEAMAKISEGM